MLFYSNLTNVVGITTFIPGEVNVLGILALYYTEESSSITFSSTPRGIRMATTICKQVLEYWSFIMSHHGHRVNHLVWFFVCALFVVGSCQKLNKTSVIQAAEELLNRYSSNVNVDIQGLTPQGFGSFLESVTNHSKQTIQDVLGECQAANNNCTKSTECPGIPEVFQSFAIENQLNAEGFINALPVVFNTLTSENCSDGINKGREHKRKHRRPSAVEAWGYSIGFASIVVVLSNIGACLGPIMDKKFFKRILQFLVAMGAGSLASTSLLVLIPEAFDIVPVEEMSGYVWKSTVAIFSIYVFFCSERILKTFLNKKKKVKNTLSKVVDRTKENYIDDLTLTPLNSFKEDGHGHSHLSTGNDYSDRQTLAWMVMAGDIIHNFVDGLSIGAAFTEDIALGISISLAVVCEELPHELADIAILIHSGLSIRKSLFINFLSACVVYIGLVLGVVMGTMIAEASKWIFAMAGGLFLYVPLVDMLPDMSTHLDTLIITGSSKEARIVAALHACGLVIGAGIIIFIVNISSYIVVD